MTLNVFNEANGIFAGINAPLFNQLEYLMATSKKANIPLPSLGLFGEASTGKTTTAKIIAKEMKFPFLLLNSADITLKNINAKIANYFIETLPKETLVPGPFPDPFKLLWSYEVKVPCVVLLDEAHELSKEVQTYLLSLLDSPHAVLW